MIKYDEVLTGRTYISAPHDDNGPITILDDICPMTTLTATSPTFPANGELRAFRPVEAWVFDLDNTLYPRHSNLFAQIDERIQSYVQKLLDVSRNDAKVIQKTFYREHGTTLRGLMVEHDIDPDDFLEFRRWVWQSPACPVANSSSPTARGRMRKRSPRDSA
jgi:hypothetical protein